MKYIGLIFISLYMLSCGNARDAAAMNKQKPLLGDYIITAVGVNSSLSEAVTITFDKEKNTISGSTGCNLFNGNYASGDSKLEFGPLATTRKMCHPESNTLEQHVLKALQDTKNYSITDDKIHFYDEAHFTILTLEKSDMTSAKATDTQNGYHVEYSEISRGSFMMITYENNKLSFQKDRNIKTQTIDLSNTELASLDKKLEALDLKALTTLEPPSTAHQYDGARIAALKVTKNGLTYTTPSFDAGNPPKAIEALILELMAPTEKL
ncbi:META domain-containing protein [Bizionia argentinensis]|nr:META domain-containing protein [Bizionia argentinensis]